jgi:hypothetical protein
MFEQMADAVVVGGFVPRSYADEREDGDAMRCRESQSDGPEAIS